MTSRFSSSNRRNSCGRAVLFYMKSVVAVCLRTLVFDAPSVSFAPFRQMMKCTGICGASQGRRRLDDDKASDAFVGSFSLVYINYRLANLECQRCPSSIILMDLILAGGCCSGSQLWRANGRSPRSVIPSMSFACLDVGYKP